MKINNDLSKNEILFLTTNIYPCSTGGMEVYNYHLVNSLLDSDVGNKIKIITSCKTIIDNFGEEKVLKVKDRLFLFRRFGLGALSNILYYSFSNKLKWKKVYLLYVPYTSNFSFNALSFLILKKIFNIKYVIHIHGGGLGKWKPYWLGRFFFKNAYKIAGVSNPIVLEYSKRTERQIEYLPPLTPFVLNSNNKEKLKKDKGLAHFNKIVLFIGSLKPLKAPSILIKAFLGLGEEFLLNQKVGLVLVGDGISRSELQIEYAEHKNIVFCGKQPNENVKDFYALSDCYVIPSWFEGTPISLLEAMFNSLPCIGTNVVGIRDIIVNEETGLLFEKDNFLELSGLVHRIISNENDSKILGNNAKKFYETHFNYKNHLLDIERFIS